jgi:hypothetical protein
MVNEKIAPEKIQQLPGRQVIANIGEPQSSGNSHRASARAQK